MKIFGITGWKNAGKTTVIEALIGELAARGFRVATIKHAHEGFDIDHQGKDSWRHRKAGASEVIVASATRWAMIHEVGQDEEEPPLDELLAKLGPCDIALVEGYKKNKHEKIQVFRGQPHETLMVPGDPTIMAVVTELDVGNDIDDKGVAILSPNDPAALADFIQARTGLAE